MTKALTISTYQDLVRDISNIYEKARDKSIQTTNKIAVRAHWEIGRRIVENEQKFSKRAQYGGGLLVRLSKDLSVKFGKGFSLSNLKYMRQFYQEFSIGHARDQLGWTHYKLLLSIKDKGKRDFYEDQIIKRCWTSRKLEETLRTEKVLIEDISKSQRRRKTAESMPKLSLARGRLYTYRLVESDYAQAQLLVDCGFDVYRELGDDSLANATSKDIVEARRDEEGYTFWRSDAKKSQLYTFVAYVDRVIDGDTIWVNIDLGFAMWSRQKLRLRGIDTPELKSQKGLKSKHYVEQKLKKVPFLVIKTHGSDKYDRYLVDILYLEGEKDPQKVVEKGEFLNQNLLDLGLAKLAD